MHPRDLRVLSGAFGSFPLSGAVVRLVFIAFGPFPCALVVWFVRVSSVHSRTPLSSLGSFGCFRYIHVRHGNSHFRNPWRSSGSFGSLRPISDLPIGYRVHSGAFGYVLSGTFCPFPYSLWVVRVFWLIHLLPTCRRVRSRAFGPFPYAQDVVGFVWLCSVHSRTPWGSFGFVCGLRVPSGAFGPSHAPRMS